MTGEKPVENLWKNLWKTCGKCCGKTVDKCGKPCGKAVEKLCKSCGNYQNIHINYRNRHIFSKRKSAARGIGKGQPTGERRGKYDIVQIDEKLFLTASSNRMIG